MFDGNQDFTGIQASYLKDLCELRGNVPDRAAHNNFKIFNSYVDAYTVCPLIGYQYRRRIPMGSSADGDVGILYEQISKKKAELRFVYQILMLIDEDSEPDEDKRIFRAFKLSEASEEDKERIAENMKIFNEYSLGTAANLLLPTGLLMDEAIQYAGSFEKYVFLQGNTNEVYTKPEIDFIEKLNDIFIFRDYLKKANKKTVPCRVMVARIDFLDIVSAGIAFNRIASKAMDGLNICLVIAGEGLLFTGTVFDQNNYNDCLVSEIMQTEEQYDAFASEMIFASDYDGFVEYYSYIRNALQYQKNLSVSSDRDSVIHRIAYSYIEELQNLEKILRVSFAKEIDRVFHAYDRIECLAYGDRVEENKESLFPIVSSRVNTMEMLFDAEEMERLASEAEMKNNEMLQRGKADQKETEILDAETKALLDDPENIIRLLKKKRGL